MAPAVAPASSRKAGRTIAVIFLALVLDLLGFACILPSFPLIMKHYEAQALPVRMRRVPHRRPPAPDRSAHAPRRVGSIPFGRHLN